MARTRRFVSPSRSRQKGYTLVATGLAIFAIIGMTGLAVDLGRMYIAKNETQAYVDSAALAGVVHLNGTLAGFDLAKAAIAANRNTWNFQHNSFTGADVSFSQSAAGPWESAPSSASDYRFIQVTAGVDVPLTFMQSLVNGETRRVNASASAGQIPASGMSGGLFPFSPFAHPPSVRLPGADPVSGLVPGTSYTLRWGAGVNLHSPGLCDGDRIQEVIDIARAGGGEERGFIEDTSADVLRRSIVYDYQTVFRIVGDSVDMTGGTKQTQRDALVERVRQDNNRTATTFAEYFNGGRTTGNGRRLVACPINLGAPGGYRIVQFGAFYLKNEEDYLAAMGGNKAFCGEYVGAYVQGGSGPGAGGPGYYVVKLVQ